jgi:acyl carrier protein
VTTRDVYAGLAAAGYAYGPSFQGLRAAWRRGDEVFADVALPEPVAASASSFGVHPALLDAAMHAAGLAGSAGGPGSGTGAGAGEVLLPFAWTGVSLHTLGASALRVRLAPATGGRGLSITAADETGSVVVSVDALLSRPVSTAQLGMAGGPADALFAVQWVPADLAAPADEPEIRCVLVGADQDGLADAVVNGGSYPDLAALTRAVAAGEPVPDLVLTRAGTAAGSVTAGLAAAGPETARAEAGRMLELIRQFLAADQLSAARLMIVTAGAVAAGPEPAVTDLAGAAAGGLVRSAQSENPGRLVLADILPDSAGGVTAGTLIIQAARSGEPELAIRGSAPYARRLARPAAGPTPPVPAITRPAGTVLITGGTGALGGLTAGHLAETGRARNLTLISRSGPAASGVAALVAGVAGHGAAAQVIACDGSDRAALETVLARIPAEYPLTAVVHTAGIVDDGVISSLTPARVDAVMRPKADAAWHLHELTTSMDLEAFVLFSSAAATFGAAGQGNYAAANAYLDGLAVWRAGQGLPAMSLAWGMWAGEAGLAGQLGAGDRARMARGGMTALTPSDGLALLDTAVTRDEAMLVPAQLDVAGVRAAAARGQDVPALWRGLVPRSGAVPASAAVSPDQRDALRRQLALLAGPEQEMVVLDLVRGHVAAVLGHSAASAIEPDQAFTDLGFDSLTAVELRNRLQAAAGLPLPATLVFDYPAPDVLARYLWEQLHPAAAAPSAADDDQLGQLLASIPLARVRQAGLLEPLLQLAALREDASGPGSADEDGETIDTLDAEALVRLAMESENTDY